ncbi:hypothetical protein NQ318_009201 [Aromia moschata]|uniref:Phospholipase A2-like domain-containing protein n=1 Tax=Aromia moschata TaxID=1265417 RepID=A0AAV8Y5X9_9CUCU|nr:hypothetical protein NQ318_009201 [Aromia moschata]
MSTVERKGCPRCLYCRGSSITGSGIVNSLINKLPIELHLPGGYQYCGPGDPGINPLDVACKHHDIAYSQNTDLTARHKADYELEQRAWERVKSNDANVGEKVAALLESSDSDWVAKQQQQKKIKKKRKKNPTKNDKKIAFGSGIVQKVRNKLKTGGCKTIALKSPRKAVEIAVHAARQTLKNAGGKRRIRTPRIIPIPKTGGILPLLPIFAGLSALGTLAGSAAGVSKVINDVKIGKQRLAEAERHNRSMESIALGKNGKGLYLKPYKTGLGLYLNARNPKNY